ncbi:pyruvate kinase [Nitrosovibrio sp. Nv17]|uniref:pyruvate kinase n=1 Tax=Nitrosovibrio sp. Nv17 TaxID=1855339 RepID=UPI000909009E|nr:pyruvate kinase [Nitrosovibrio sp. Nv17]SFW21547.1 pyruvate kinase [Nitrosovibrio sp. Nv17]
MTPMIPMTPGSWQRTKIVCTLGPATDAPGVIEGLIEYGMDVARVNASHGGHADHARRIRRVREVAGARGQPVAILMDLPGPKFRIGDLADGARTLAEGESAWLAMDERSVPAAADHVLPLRDPELLQALRAGESVFLADGLVELRVAAREAAGIRCEVRAGGTVRSGSGINVPDSTLGELVPTGDDRRHLAFAVAQEIEWVGVSFVQSTGDLARVRACLPVSAGGEGPLLVAKIEKRRALADLDAIVAAADGVMVARGDLGVETDLAEIPLVQKRIIAAANICGRPVITATQMLESMVERERPTRAEATDVANAVLDGTDAVMLSAETAIGRFPAAAVRFLARVLAATEREADPGPAHDRMRAGDAAGSRDAPEGALGFAACQLAARLGARAIVMPAGTLAGVLGIARLRPRVPLLAVTGSARLYRSLALVRGVAPLFVPAGGGEGDGSGLAQAGRWLVSQGLAAPGDPVVLVAASGSGGVPDTLRTVRLGAARGPGPA